MPLTGHPQRSSAIATFCRGVFLWTSAVCLKGNTFGGSCDPRAGIGGSLKPKGLEPKQLGLVYDALLCFVYMYVYICVCILHCRGGMLKNAKPMLLSQDSSGIWRFILGRWKSHGQSILGSANHTCHIADINIWLVEEGTAGTQNWLNTNYIYINR